jgi:hypothetical protein
LFTYAILNIESELIILTLRRIAMEVEQQKLVKDVMKAVADDEPKEEILKRARDAKVSLSAVWSEYQQAINMVDALVKTYVPSSEWQTGWWSPTIAAQQLAPPTRPVLVQPPDKTKRVLAIATSLKAGEQKRVTVKAVMQQLRTEGDQRPDKKMAISIGNILSWSKKWKRVAPGEYEPVESASQEEKEKE